MKRWEVLSSKMVLNEPWYKVRADTVSLPSGQVIENYFLSIRDDYVIVLPLTAKNKAVLVKQYKHGAGKVLWELPGGLIKRGESPSKTAERELLEETGYEAQRIKYLGTFHDNPTKNTNKMYAFLAINVKKTKKQLLDDSEEIKTKEVKQKELLNMIAKGKFQSLTSVLTALLALTKYKYG